MKKSELRNIIREIIIESINEAEQTAQNMVVDIEKIIKKYFPTSFSRVDYSESIAPSIHIAFAIGQKKDWSGSYFENSPLAQKMFIHGFDKGGGMSRPVLFDPKWVRVSIKPPEGSHLAFGSAKVPVRKKKGDYNSILKGIDSTFSNMHKVLKANVDNLDDNHNWAKKYI